MSFKKELNRKVQRFMSAKKATTGGVRGTNVVDTDFAKDLEGLSNELIRKVGPTAVSAAATIVRKEAVNIMRQGGGESRLGMSKKTLTRGKLPYRGTERTNEAYLTNAGRGAWFGTKMIQKRGGAKGPSLGQKKTIIKRPIKRKQGGLHSKQIVGPKYASDPTGKNWAHTHEMPAGKTVNHKWWGKPAKRRLKRRPLMGPAGENTISKQRQAIRDAVIKWKTKRPDLDE